MQKSTSQVFFPPEFNSLSLGKGSVSMIILKASGCRKCNNNLLNIYHLDIIANRFFPSNYQLVYRESTKVNLDLEELTSKH